MTGGPRGESQPAVVSLEQQGEGLEEQEEVETEEEARGRSNHIQEEEARGCVLGGWVFEKAG